MKEARTFATPLEGCRYALEIAETLLRDSLRVWDENGRRITVEDLNTIRGDLAHLQLVLDTVSVLGERGN